jgi:hypothetical protein
MALSSTVIRVSYNDTNLQYCITGSVSIDTIHFTNGTRTDLCLRRQAIEGTAMARDNGFMTAMNVAEQSIHLYTNLSKLETKEHEKGNLFGDSKLIIKSFTNFNAGLQAKWLTLSYHRVRADNGISVIQHLTGASIQADMLSKHY